MPEAQTKPPMTGAQLLAFKGQIKELDDFLRDRFDMNKSQQASFLVNALAVKVIDLYDEVENPQKYVNDRLDNITECVRRNFNSFYNTKVR